MGQAAVVLLSALRKPGGLGDQADCASFGQRSESEAEETRTRNPGLASATLLLTFKTARRWCRWSSPVPVLPAESDSLVERQEARMSCFRGHRWSRHSPSAWWFVGRPSMPDLAAPRGCALSSSGASSRFGGPFETTKRCTPPQTTAATAVGKGQASCTAVGRGTGTGTGRPTAPRTCRLKLELTHK